MDDFLFVYLFVMAIGGLVFIAFWGAVIYFGIKLFRGNKLSTEQKLQIASGLLRGYSGGNGRYEPGPIESEVRSIAANEGIDLDR